MSKSDNVEHLQHTGISANKPKKNKKTNSETDKIRNMQLKNVTHHLKLLNYPISESWGKKNRNVGRENFVLCYSEFVIRLLDQNYMTKIYSWVKSPVKFLNRPIKGHT